MISTSVLSHPLSMLRAIEETEFQACSELGPRQRGAARRPEQRRVWGGRGERRRVPDSGDEGVSSLQGGKDAGWPSLDTQLGLS